MNPLRPIAAIFILCSALGILSGCEHKKPVLIVPKQAPPAAAPSPSPTPDAAATQTEQQPQEQTGQPQTAKSEESKPEPEKQEKSKPKKSSRHKPAPSAGEKSSTEVAKNTPPKKVIPAEKAEPTPGPGQISPGPTPAAGGQDQTSTEQLLQLAESNLNAIKRQLTRDEEIKRAQVKEFISQSRKAITENDLARAHNWAVKAQLLSDELIKQR